MTRTFVLANSNSFVAANKGVTIVDIHRYTCSGGDTNDTVKLPQGTGTFGDAHVSSFYQGKGVTPNAFCLKEINVDNSNIILNSMSANNATCLDDLSPRFVKGTLA